MAIRICSNASRIFMRRPHGIRESETIEAGVCALPAYQAREVRVCAKGSAVLSRPDEHLDGLAVSARADRANAPAPKSVCLRQPLRP